MTLIKTEDSLSTDKTIKDDGEEENVKPEIRLLFFGTFFHENTELTADLIQLKETAQITEIRVIPLGATVDLSTGAFQLGATNPSEFELEFYYNDLQVPTKSTFELLRNFKFNDKSRIQLVCESTEQIITDGLLVRGVYSTVTLAVYGFKVDKVPIKEIVSESKKMTPPPLKLELPVIVSPPLEERNINIQAIESPEKSSEQDSDTIYVVQEIDREAEVLIPLEIQQIPPQAIPTITTRVNYDAVQTSLEEESYSEELLTEDRKELDSTSEEAASLPKEIEKASASQAPVEVMDTEEISDGEVFPSDDEDDMHIEPVVKEDKLASEDTVILSVKTIVDPLIEAVEPISSPPQEQLSDVDDSLLDEFQEPGFEEIISDEEMPDFPDYDYRDWEENWAHKFTKTFNPFSESFQVSVLRNIKMDDVCLAACNRRPEECWEILLAKAEKMSRDQFIPNLLESWVEDMECLIPLIPSALCISNTKNTRDRSCIERSLWFWVEIGTNLKLAVEQPSLPFKTRHIKAGVRLIQCLANCGGHISNSLVKLEFPVEENDKEYISGCATDSVSIQHRLIDLLKEPHMNNVTKLSILRTLDATTSTKKGFEKFTTVSFDGMTSYQRLLECSLNPGFSARMSFSFRSLQKKVQLMEGLLALEVFVKEFVRKSYSLNDHSPPTIDTQVFEQHLTILEDLVTLAHHVDQYFSHPLRVLPAKSVVELPPLCSAGFDPRVSFVKLLKETNFIQLAAVLVNAKEISGKVVGPISEMLLILLNWEAGLIYICSENDSVTILLRCLMQLDDDISAIASLAAHCTEVMKCVDVLSSDCYKTDSEEDRDEDVRSLQVVVSFLVTSVGREALVKTLSKGNFILPFLKCIKVGETDSRFRHLSRLEKSARKGYAVEILDLVIRSSESMEFLKKHGPTLYNTISSLSESNEGSEKLLDAQAFLKPTLNPLSFTLDGIEILCDIIKLKKDELMQASRNPENNWGFPSEMVTALRILCELVTAPEDSDASKNLLISTDEMLVRELKYDLALVQIHSLDMISMLLAILQKIVQELLQPTIHAHVFVSSRGDTIVSLLLPLIKVLRKSIYQVIQVRKTEFRDVSAVPILIKVYGLVEYFPSNSLSYSKAQEIGQNIIGILLAYTVPAIKIGTETEEELNKSTWTAVISEIIKFTLEEPANFQTGLSLLTEMLPLPLPIASKTSLSEETCLESIKLRRLWSAYIHGLSPQLQEMIGILCGSTNARLLNLLKRVCVQLADLSGSSCLVVCRAILDAILQSMELELETNIDSQANNSQISSVKAWLDMTKAPGDCQCSPHTTRLLGFLASLVNNYSPIKCGILHTMKGSTKIDEKYSDLLNFFCSILLTNPATSSSNFHIQGQDHVVTIFQSFCDVEINMLVPMFGRTEKTYESEFILANSLPQREHLVAICSTLVNYLSSMDSKVSNTGQVLEGILRTLEIIAETDYGFYHLRTSMDKKSGSLSKIAKSLASNDIQNSDNFETLLPCIMSFLDLLKSITSARSQQMGSFPPRYSFLKPDELMKHLEWTIDETIDSTSVKTNVDTTEHELKDIKLSTSEKIEKEDVSDETAMDIDLPSTSELNKNIKQMKDEPSRIHPLVQLKNFLEKQLSKLRDGLITLTNVEPHDLDIGLEIFHNLFQLMKDNQRNDAESGSSFESALPASETLLELYTLRPVSVLVDRMGTENLPVFWLTSIPPAFELDTENAESELVTCDLEELSRTYLNGFDVSKEIQNMAKASDLQASCGKDEIKAGETKYAHPGARTPSLSLSHMHRRPPYNSQMRGGPNRGIYGRGLLPGPGRMGAHIYDPFRSRPPNTSRPPSLHVDDFVAMESSGQPGPVQLRSSGGSDNFNNRGRGSPRGGLLTRPFSHDRGRNLRPGQASGGYYQTKRHDSQSVPQGRGSRGGRIYTTPTSDRWTADNRTGPQTYDRGNRSTNYEDKYRSSSIGPNRSGVSSPRNHNQPYPQRTGYRDARSGGANNSPRWRDRQNNNKPFNR